MKKVGIVMGSASDLPVVKKAIDMLVSLDIPHEVHVFIDVIAGKVILSLGEVDIVVHPMIPWRISCGSKSFFANVL